MSITASIAAEYRREHSRLSVIPGPRKPSQDVLKLVNKTMKSAPWLAHCPSRRALAADGHDEGGRVVMMVGEVCGCVGVWWWGGSAEAKNTLRSVTGARATTRLGTRVAGLVVLSDNV